jgi:GNAT superfamily N-acetyltransferase
MRLRWLTLPDIPGAMRLKDAAGWNQTALDWERLISANPEGCFAAEHEGRLIGTSTTITYEDRFAWIGMVVVDAQHRGHGVGTKLLQAAIQYLDSRGVPCMKLDATPLGKPLYEKLGFVSEYEVERWMLSRNHAGAGAWPARTERQLQDGFSNPDLQDVLALDHQIFGADRSALLRSVAQEAPEFTVTIRQGQTIAGYAFGRHGSRADHLGPWMAREQETAAKLLDAFLQRSTGELVFVDCVSQNPWAVAMVRARGFEFSRPLTRMVRGTNQHSGKPEVLCAILGPEFG